MKLTRILAPVLLSAALAAPVWAQTGATAPKSSTAPHAATGTMGTAPVSPSTATHQMVNINTATAAQLDQLPEIGKKRAAKIIAGRPYKSVDELLSKKVIGKSVYEKIKDRITAS